MKLVCVYTWYPTQIIKEGESICWWDKREEEQVGQAMQDAAVLASILRNWNLPQQDFETPAAATASSWSHKTVHVIKDLLINKTRHTGKLAKTPCKLDQCFSWPNHWQPYFLISLWMWESRQLEKESTRDLQFWNKVPRECKSKSLLLRRLVRVAESDSTTMWLIWSSLAIWRPDYKPQDSSP